MQELQRLAYLDALGIDSYVSRKQLPGAAVTRRLAVRGAGRSVAVEKVAGPPTTPAVPPPQRVERIRERPGRNTTDRTPALPETGRPGTPVPRFSLVAIVAGEWLWLEELVGMPLTTEQVRLVHAMARALYLERGKAASSLAARPEVTQFDWPIHSNHQLDQGEEAARAGVAGFIGRKLEQHGCMGLVLLGQPCAARVPDMGIHRVTTAGSAEILARPALKAQVWRELLPLVRLP